MSLGRTDAKFNFNSDLLTLIFWCTSHTTIGTRKFDALITHQEQCTAVSHLLDNRRHVNTSGRVDWLRVTVIETPISLVPEDDTVFESINHKNFARTRTR